jgi:hypothetical protein
VFSPSFSDERPALSRASGIAGAVRQKPVLAFDG